VDRNRRREPEEHVISVWARPNPQMPPPHLSRLDAVAELATARCNQ
jgi:hypothetical protein